MLLYVCIKLRTTSTVKYWNNWKQSTKRTQRGRTLQNNMPTSTNGTRSRTCVHVYIPVYQYIYSRFEHRVSVQRENHFDPSDLVQEHLGTRNLEHLQYYEVRTVATHSQDRIGPTVILVVPNHSSKNQTFRDPNLGSRMTESWFVKMKKERRRQSENIFNMGTLSPLSLSLRPSFLGVSLFVD